jgi:DNA-directed RNA polymerase subunit E'/Rpb7
MTQIGLYYTTELETTVPLYSNQQTRELDQHLLSNLKTKVEGKYEDSGIIIRVDKVLNFYGGAITTTRLATTNYTVKYQCLICCPTKELEIVCIIDDIIKGFAVGHNGPLSVVVQLIGIDNKKFRISDDSLYHIPTQKKLKSEDYLKVVITSDSKDKYIVCNLLDIANDDDIKKFNDEQKLIKNTTDNKIFI